MTVTAQEAAALTERLLDANTVARLTRPRAVCVWCTDPIDPDTWDGWEVFANGDIAGPCCNTCSAPARP